MVIVLFSPDEVFEGYRIVRLLPPEGEIHRYQVASSEGAEFILYCRIHRKAAADQVDTFLAKADKLRALKHPHLPAMGGAGYARGSIFWIAVAAPAGKSLRDVLNEEPHPGDVPMYLILAHQIASVLETALAGGFVHFALTPDHIYVNEADFELSTLTGVGIRMVFDAAPQPPRRHEILYRSPEQMLRQDATYSADIYSLGMILYELISGESPYVDQLRELGVMDIEQAPEMMVELFTTVYPTRLAERLELETVVEQLVFAMIAKKPSQRVSTWKRVMAGIARVGSTLATAQALQGPAERESLERSLAVHGAPALRTILANYSPQAPLLNGPGTPALSAPGTSLPSNGAGAPSSSAGAPSSSEGAPSSSADAPAPRATFIGARTVSDPSRRTVKMAFAACLVATAGAGLSALLWITSPPTLELARPMLTDIPAPLPAPAPILSPEPSPEPVPETSPAPAPEPAPRPPMHANVTPSPVPVREPERIRLEESLPDAVEQANPIESVPPPLAPSTPVPPATKRASYQSLVRMWK
jgi:serine/threonine protein kinase